MKKRLLLFLTPVLLGFSGAFGHTAEVLGPGGGGGQFFPTINANDPDNVMVRCDMSGTFITHDNAQTWDMVNFGKTPLDYAIDPQDPDVLYVAAQGLFQSKDRGRTWRIVFPVADEIARIQHFGDHSDPEIFLDSGACVSEVSCICVDPGNSRHIWIGQMDGTVQYSRDGGGTWNAVSESLGEPVRALFPGRFWGHPREVLAAGAKALLLLKEGKQGGIARALPESPLIDWSGGVVDGKFLLYVISQTSVFTSRDLGETWSKRPVADEALRLTKIAACAGDPLTAYVGCRQKPYGILKTTDGGSTWNWVYRVEGNAFINDNYENGWLDESYGPEWRGYPIGLGVSPVNPDVCYATDYGSTYRTMDGGVTWHQVYTRQNADGSYTSRGLDVTTCYGVHFDPFDPEHLFVSYTDIGAFQSHDGGKGWEHAVKGIPNQWDNTCYWMVFDPTIEGRAWSVWGNKHDLPRHKMFRHGRLLEGARGGVALSTDSATTWTPLTENGLPEDAVCTHIVLDPRSPEDKRVLYVTAFQRGIYKSSDSGSSWSRLPDVPGHNRNYWRLAMAPDGDLLVMVSRDRKGDRWKGEEFSGGLYRSSDGGTTWSIVKLPRGYDNPHDLVFDPQNPDILYLSLWAGSFEGGDPFTTPVGGGLLMSRDDGESWKQVFDPSAFVYSATPDPRDPERLYLVTFEGAAFFSENRGETWNLIQGYDFKWGHRPVPDPYNEGMLYITTFGGGLWHGPVKGGDRSPILNVDPRWRWHRVLQGD